MQENFASILRKLDIDIIFDFCLVEVKNKYWVKVSSETEPIELNEYLETYLDKTDRKHATIRQHIIIASRNYYNRFKAFIKNILMDKSNPMCVKYWVAKTEFQGRGAGE